MTPGLDTMPSEVYFSKYIWFCSENCCIQCNNESKITLKTVALRATFLAWFTELT